MDFSPVILALAAAIPGIAAAIVSWINRTALQKMHAKVADVHAMAIAQPAMMAGDALSAKLREMLDMLGPPPAQPTYRDEVNGQTGDLGGIWGGEGQPGTPDGTPVKQDPNNALLQSDYQAQLAAYNARYQLLLQKLLETKS